MLTKSEKRKQTMLDKIMQEYPEMTLKQAHDEYIQRQKAQARKGGSAKVKKGFAKSDAATRARWSK